MPGVQADAVIVLIEAKTAKYFADMEAAAKKTENVFKRIRNANKPISLSTSSKSTNSTAEREALKTEGVIRREAEKTAAAKQRLADKTTANAEVQASKTASAEEKAAAKAALAAEKAAARKAAADEKAAQRAIAATERKAAREKAILDKAAAEATAREARRNASAAKRVINVGSAVTPGTGNNRPSPAPSATSTRLGSGTALGNGGSMPAPTPAADKVNYFLRDQIDTQGRFNAAQAAGNREEANALRDQLTQFRLINQYKRAGLDETEATARAEDRVADIARRRANRAQATPVDAAPTRGGGLAGAARTVRNLATVGFAGYGAVQGAKEYLELTDAYKQYNAQLKLATAENGNLAQAQLDVQRIATTTRSGLAETAQLYATFQRNAGQLGLSQEQAARATETVTKSFQISGATAAEASGGLRQFLQGLQSGTLRGEEFNSVVENAPRLAKLLADQLTGGNIGALRALSAAGKITGKDLKEALTNQKFTAQIDAEFKQLPVTFDQAMAVLKNAATVTFGEFDQGGQFSTSLANFITGGSAGFADLAKSASDTGIDIRATFAGLSDVFAPILSGAQSAFGGVRQEANYTRDTIASLLSGIDQLRNIPANLQNKANAFDRNVFGTQFRKDAPLSNTSGQFLQGARRSETRSRLDRSVRRLEAQGFIVPRNTDGSVNEAGIQRPSARRSATFQPIAPRPIAAPKSGGGNGGAGSSAQAAQAKVERQDDQFQQQNANLDDALLSAKGRQAKGIEETLATDIAQADSENAKRKERFDQFTAAQQAELNAKSDSIAAQKKITAVYDAIIATANQNAELAINEKSAAVDAKQAEIDMTIGRAARAKLEDELLDLKYEERRLQIEKNKALAIQNGDVAGADKADRDATANATDREVGRFRNREDNKSPYQKYRDNLSNADSLSDEIDNIKIEVLDQVADSLANATTKALGLTGALGDIVGQIIKIGIQRRLIGPLADNLFGKADGSSSGAGGSIISSLTNFLSGSRASGGDVSAGKIYKVNEMGVELFQPSMSGKIIPTGRVNANRGGSTVIQPQINVDARGAVMNDQFAAQILARANKTSKAYATQAGRTAYESSPSRSQRLSTLGT